MAEVFTGLASLKHVKSWEGRDLGTIGGAQAVILFADSSYRWHENGQDELFCVVDGTVDMEIRDDRGERRVTLERGDIALIPRGESHVAHPRGEARILIVAGN